MSNASLTPPGRNSTDWLKYLPFEKQSWRQIIANSGLPDEAKELIYNVIRKSRLMRFEKIEVIQELIGHFQDGQLAGKDYPYLIANFGDPEITAQLVRRSKIRNRPIMFKILQIFGWMLLGIVSAYFMVFAYFHSAKPNPTVDYIAELNALQTDVSDDEKAWPIYRPLWTKYGFSEGGELARSIGSTLHHSEGDEEFARLVRPGDPEWPGAVAKLEEISDLLDAFREGAKKKRLGLELQADRTKYSAEDFAALYPGVNKEDVEPFSYEDDEVEAMMRDAVINVLLPHIQQLRSAARIFVVDTRWAVEQNDSQRAVENFETFMGLASQAADTNILVGSLVGFAVAGIGFNELEETLLNHPDFFNDQQLAQLQKSIARMSFTEMTRIEGEKWFQLDLVQRAYSDDGNGNGRITPLGVKVYTQGLMNQQQRMIHMTGDENLDRIGNILEKAAAPAALFVLASRKDTEEKIHEFVDGYAAAVRQPYWERDMPDAETFLEANTIQHAFLNALLPAYESVISATNRLDGRQEGVLTGLALQRYFLANGQWPETMVDLAGYMDELPVDIINGQELLLKFNDIGPVVYSVGLDHDDDGGIQCVDGFGARVPAVLSLHGKDLNGDWILWPQSRYDERGLMEDDAKSEQTKSNH